MSDWLQPMPDEYGLGSRMTWGKHTGKTIRQIIDINPDWLSNTLASRDDFFLNKRAEKKLKEVKKCK